MNLWQKRFVLVGDSIQAWVFDDATSNPANPNNLMAVRIGSVYNAATIQNLSCPGATLAGPLGLGNYPDDVQHVVGYFGINGLIVTLGANDIASPDITIPQFQQKYADYIVAVRKFYSGPIIMLSPLVRYDQTVFPLGKTQAAMRDSIQSLAAYFGGVGAGLYFIDGLTCALGAERFNDGLHLNNGGHYLFSSWFYDKVHALGLW